MAPAQGWHTNSWSVPYFYISPKKTYGWLTNTWKDAHHHSLSEKCKSKPQWGTITHRSERLRSKNLQTINAEAGVEKRYLLHCWWECKLVQPLWRTVWRFLKKLEIELPSVQFSRSVVSSSLWPHELQHTRPPCPAPTPGVHSNSRPSSQWCHPAISSLVVPFSSCP